MEGSEPAKPTGLSATATHDQVILTWDDPNDDTITGYQVLRADTVTVNEAPGEFAAIAPDTGSNGTTYTDTTVEPERSYMYRVHAISPQGVSGAVPGPAGGHAAPRPGGPGPL